MMKKSLIAGLLAMALSGSAFAFHCPAEMKKIDEALAKNPMLTAEQMTEVKQLRAEGETLHKAGKHQEALDTLEKAKKILKIET
ncbi:Uncharacterized protein pbN1_14810 [Aromatoleum bremense]|uniref:Uncharacterized protein n=2 Tax=Aromatoleum bremense TaxID=76115 RepID=A0ABX1NSZ4_9RHOO|nr:hypothetical protein [Aromatoleum bremense]QTQ31473.1 Uncharacterized protein pbN1_14810 [Aromatoleum bremense]